MAKKVRTSLRTGSGARIPQAPTTGLWTKRNTASGQFVEVKRSGEPFKGVRREN